MSSSKRLLKKEIRLICGALAGECVLAKIAIPGIDREKLNKIIYELAELQENALRRISISFPQTASAFPDAHAYRKTRREYFAAAFAKLKSEFNTHIEAIVKEMNSTMPQAQKDANVAALKGK
ncbi:MAG: hypothetical protein NC411_05545 [Bacteroides sp.]|nr:hypothetical protein [Bacteroides sp.]